MTRMISLIKRKIGQWLYLKGTHLNNTGKVALCCIGKCENDYALEFVEYYKKLGFDKIYIYDNNDPEGEHFETVIEEYIKSSFCEIIDFRGFEYCQLKAYQDCYDRHNKEYDWLAFFDFDEFLTLVHDADIHSFLEQKKFKNYQMIHINWMCFGDNEMLDTDGRRVLDRFKVPLPFETKNEYEFPENNHIKTILRGNLKNVTWTSVHTPYIYYGNCCNAIGKRCESTSPFCIYDFSSAYLRHYVTKTIGEWVRIKMKRGNCNMNISKFQSIYRLDRFFLMNKKTVEKEAYAKGLKCL